MSLDVYLMVDGEYVYSANITHNLNAMAMQAGFYEAMWRPEELGAKQAKDIIPLLQEGLCKLVCDPTKYKEFDSPNGWGTYKDFVPFVIEYLAACKIYPEALIEVSR